MKHPLSFFFALTLASLAVAEQSAVAEQRADEYNRRGGARVTFFENANFSGASVTLYPGDSIENLDRATFEGGRRINDRISSIRVEGGAEVTIFLDAKYRGETMRITRDVRNFADVFLPNNSKTWNDQISSVRVEGRGYGRPPGKPSYGDPDKLIKRAYEDILLRPADPDGLRDFRIKMLDQGWTEQQVRESLRRSDEFKDKVATEMVGRAYRDVLKREPDPNGLRHYRDKIVNHDWTEASVKDDLRKSDEYKRRR